MIYDLFYVSKTADPVGWLEFKTRYPTAQLVKNVKSFVDIQSQSFTKMFWVVWDDLIVSDDFDFSYRATKWDDQYIHVFKNDNHYDGICLFPKNISITQKEFDYRFFIDKKEIDIVASSPKKYDVFDISTFADYENAFNESTTEMFWIVPNDVEVVKDFAFDTYFSHHNSYDRQMNHVFVNIFRGDKTYTGVMLMSKNKKVTSKEINYRFLIEKKEHDIIASKTKPYDIVFISYNEPNAETNYKALQRRFPRAKRVHGVKGIHQAHIAAAHLCNTDMFWVVDGDAVIVDDFNFDYEVSRYETNIVHVWRSQNPINDLVYGYGGVKLLPRQMTIDMDTSKPDMTTSISQWFKPVEDTSNITAFNTDPFNTWKSAFRECAKLASKLIDRQNEDETNERLETWTTVGHDRDFGEYAIQGARAGLKFGLSSRDSIQLINDFDWLKEKFNEV